MDLEPDNWLLSTNGKLVQLNRTLAHGESFANHDDMVNRVNRPDDDKHARLLSAEFAGGEAPGDFLLMAID